MPILGSILARLSLRGSLPLASWLLGTRLLLDDGLNLGRQRFDNFFTRGIALLD